jgi:alpha-beta hydrolase superfamily lysophospholipase
MWIAAAVLAAGLLPAAAVCVMAWRRFTPPRDPAEPFPDAAGLGVEDVTIPAEGDRLRGWLVRPAFPAEGTVILVHGWGSTAQRMLAWSRFLARGGWASLAFDARGHGRTGGDGPITLPRLARDVEAAAAFVATHPDLGPRPLVLLGHSVGGAAVLLALSRGLAARAAIISSAFARVEALADHVLRSSGLPPPLFRPLVKRVWGIRTGEDLSALEPETTIRRAGVPLLLTHGDGDPLIPEAELDRLVRVAPPGTSVLRLCGAAHSDMADFPQYQEAILAFLALQADPGR